MRRAQDLYHVEQFAVHTDFVFVADADVVEIKLATPPTKRARMRTKVDAPLKVQATKMTRRSSKFFLSRLCHRSRNQLPHVISINVVMS